MVYLLLLYIEYFKLKHALRCVYINNIADFVAEKPSAKGGIVTDSALHGVGLLGADDGVYNFFVKLNVTNRDLAADTNLVSLAAALDNLGVFYQILILGDFGIELALFGFRLVIFAVFGKVAEGAGLFDLLRNLFFSDCPHVVQLFFKLL
jgi:hypothetical protein